MDELDEILSFWAGAQDKWWVKDRQFDAEIARRFAPTHARAVTGACDDWQERADGTLALIILLDQFSRNIYRNDARAFACDAQALQITRSAIAAQHDQQMRSDLRFFCYLPLMHSEDIGNQDECVRQMEMLGAPNQIKFAVLHRDIIQRFGRFPHRNTILDRTTSQEEQEFLDAGGFAG